MYCIIKCKKTNVKQIKFFYIANKIVILTIILIKKTTVYCNLKCNRTERQSFQQFGDFVFFRFNGYISKIKNI